MLKLFFIKSAISEIICNNTIMLSLYFGRLEIHLIISLTFEEILKPVHPISSGMPALSILYTSSSK